MIVANGDETLLKLSSPSALEGVRVSVKVSIQSDSYGDRNVIKGFSYMEKSVDAAVSQAKDIFGI